MLDRRSLVLSIPTLAVGSVAGAAPASPNYICILGTGQSLIARWGFAGNPAFAALVERLRASGERRSISMCHAAAGGSSLLKTFSRTDLAYWWDEFRDKPGPMLDRAIRILSYRPTPPTCILWGQGETECYTRQDVDSTWFIQHYVQAGYRVFSALRDAIGSPVPIFVQRLGPMRGRMDFYPRQEIIRTVQDRWVKTMWGNIFWGALPDDRLPLADTVHPTDEGFRWLGENTADMLRGRV